MAKCRILLAVIGKEWLDVRDDQGRRRLDDPGDFVRIEIAAALEREIPVIPVLVGGKVPKPGELPEDLKDLAYRNGLEIRPDPDFFGDMNRLIRGIQKLLEEDLVVHEQNAGVQLIEPVSTAGQRTVSSPGIQIPSTFRFLREATHSCGGASNPVQEYLHEPTGMEFVLIPGGSYEIDSKPVQLSPCLMGKHPVTQKVWKKVMGNNPSGFKGDDRPVESVSWDDCQEFCKKAGLLLPTEVQWEAACRAGTKTKFYWGDSDSSIGDYAWCSENSGDETHPVGQKKPNAYGLFDMSGNVWEWCQDWYGGDYPSGTVDPKGPSSGSFRVNRGGSYCNDPDICVSGFRFRYFPVNRDIFLGFRVCQAGL